MVGCFSINALTGSLAQIIIIIAMVMAVAITQKYGVKPIAVKTLSSEKQYP